MNVDLKYSLPINNKEEWKKVDGDESFDIFSRIEKVEFFQPTKPYLHYFVKKPMETEGIKIVTETKKSNFNKTDNYFDYIRKH